MDEYKSGEKIFSRFEEESHLFIKKYNPLYGEIRGTRSSTIVIVTENKLRVYERTYQWIIIIIKLIKHLLFIYYCYT